RRQRERHMTGWLLRRLAWSVLVIVIVTAVTFVIFFAIPGKPAELIAGEYASKGTVALIEKRLGLDKPPPIQFATFITRAARGDWGYSYVSQQPVLGTILSAFPRTLSLTVGAVVIWLAFGIPL